MKRVRSYGDDDMPQTGKKDVARTLSFPSSLHLQSYSKEPDPTMPKQLDASKPGKQAGEDESNMELVVSFVNRLFLSSPQRKHAEDIVSLIVSEETERIASKLRQLQELALLSLKEITREIIVKEEDKGKLRSLQEVLRKRSDLNLDTLLKSHPAQLQILAAVKTGLPEFLQRRHNSLIMSTDLVEIILNLRCGNITCKTPFLMDVCDCSFCTPKNGFCNFCMCLVCSKFEDYSSAETCGWVRCDHCRHCCHTECALDKLYIKNSQTAAPSILRVSSQLLFCCPACEHPSDMLSFVEDVFQQNAAKWEAKELLKQLDYVKKIFSASNDAHGIWIQDIADHLLAELELGANVVEVYNQIASFLNDYDAFDSLFNLDTKDSTAVDSNGLRVPPLFVSTSTSSAFMHPVLILDEYTSEEDTSNYGSLLPSPKEDPLEETQARNQGSSSSVFSIQVDDLAVQSFPGNSVNGEHRDDHNQDDYPHTSLGNSTSEALAVQFVAVMQVILSRTLGNKVFVKWAFIVLNMAVEIFQAVLAQERAQGKMHRQIYLVVGIITSSVCLAMSLVEAFHKGRSSRVVWQKRGRLWWFYHPGGGQTRLFGSLILYFSIICPLIQLVINVIAKVTHKDFIKFDYIPLLLSVLHMVAAVISSEEKAGFSAIVDCNTHGSKEVEGKILKDSGKYLFECPDCSSRHSLRRRIVNQHSS